MNDTGPTAASERLRCFVGAFLAADSSERLSEATLACLGHRLVKARWARQVPPENYHVTLKFLGEIGAPAVQEALTVVASLTGRGVTTQVTGLVGFPRPRSSRLVAAGLDPHPQLEAWWAALEARLGVEGREFRPHVTVLRLRRPCVFMPVELPEPVTVALRAPQLYRSDRVEGRVRYQPVEH